jgi:uncharacterized protein YkwD
MWRNRLILILGALALAACGSEGGSYTGQDGYWFSDQLDFELCNGKVTSLRVRGVSCKRAAAAGGAFPACSRTYQPTPGAEWNVRDGALAIKDGAFQLEGVFTSTGHFVADYDFVDPSCCGSTGTLEADFRTASGYCGGPEQDVIHEYQQYDVKSEADAAQETEAQDPPTLALELVNLTRLAVGVAVMTSDARIQQAAQAHADCVANNQQAYSDGSISVHEEDPGMPGFTGESFDLRLEAAGYNLQSGWEVIAFYDDPAQAVPAWIATLYHRIPLVHPNARQLGYGHATVGGYSIDVMDVTGTYQPVGDAPSLYPPDGTTDVDRSWDGLEVPLPYLPPPYTYPSGPVITAVFPLSVNPVISDFTLVDDQGAPVPCQWLNPDNDQHLEVPVTHCLLPLEPLPGLTAYTARLAGTLKGNNVEYVWGFTTRP